MKRIVVLWALLILLVSFAGCASAMPPSQVAATTLPVYEFTSRICEGTGITVTRLVTESVSCLHDYSLNVSQVRATEAAELIVISGAGLEEFMEDLLHDKAVIDSSKGIALLECAEPHGHEHDHHHHEHEADSHIWLSPENAKIIASNIYTGLVSYYPQHRTILESNLKKLLQEIDALDSYGKKQLSDLTCRELVTFHDGFSYLAQAYDLTILKAVEEESGSEASASELKELILLVRDHQLPAIFTEANGSVSAAELIARETGTNTFTLDMAMSTGWFDAMYRNIDTLKEALE